MIWSDFLDTADRLARAATEADWRSAASRAYYAVFHFFREVFLSEGLRLGRGGQSHFNLYSGLLNCGETAAARLGSRVDDLRQQRTLADYDLGQHVSAVVRDERCWRSAPDCCRLSIAPSRHSRSPDRGRRAKTLAGYRPPWAHAMSDRAPETQKPGGLGLPGLVLYIIAGFAA